MKKIKAKSKNPILYYIDDIPVRKSNYVTMVFDSRDFDRILRAALLHKTSKAKIIKASCSPCNQCGNDNVEEPFKIKKNIIISKRGESGKSISQINNQNDTK